MIGSAAIDWTQVLVYAVPTTITAVFAGVAAILSASNRRNLKTPSGDSIGKQVEDTHHLANAHTALLINMASNGVAHEPEPPPGAPPVAS